MFLALLQCISGCAFFDRINPLFGDVVYYVDDDFKIVRLFLIKLSTKFTSDRYFVNNPAGI